MTTVILNRWRTRILICFNSLLLIGCLSLAPSVHAGVSGLIVVGLGGTNEYRQMFETAADETREALSSSVVTSNASAAAPGVANPGQIDVLLENASDRKTIMAYLNTHVEFLMQEIERGQTHQFVLALFGHGNFDGDDYKFNIAGPDITARELDSQLRKLDGVAQLLVLGTSASGAATEWLAHKDRTIVTATKSGSESNVVQFPRYWTDALSGFTADVNHDEQLSVIEAFEYTAQAVADHYENRQQLATEHPRLFGEMSNDTVLMRIGSLKGTENNDRVNQLLEQRRELEEQFNTVKDSRNDKPQSIYLDELETVLIEIARLQKVIDDVTGWASDQSETN